MFDLNRALFELITCHSLNDSQQYKSERKKFQVPECQILLTMFTSLRTVTQCCHHYLLIIRDILYLSKGTHGIRCNYFKVLFQNTVFHDVPVHNSSLDFTFTSLSTTATTTVIILKRRRWWWWWWFLLLLLLMFYCTTIQDKIVSCAFQFELLNSLALFTLSWDLTFMYLHYACKCFVFAWWLQRLLSAQHVLDLHAVAVHFLFRRIMNSVSQQLKKNKTTLLQLLMHN